MNDDQKKKVDDSNPINEKDYLYPPYDPTPKYYPMRQENPQFDEEEKRKRKFKIAGIVLLIVIGIPLILLGTCILLISTY